MPSDPSPKNANEPKQDRLFPSSPQTRHARLMPTFSEVLENQRPRLEAEASWLGVELDTIWEPLMNQPAQETLELFASRNPEIDLERLDQTQPYELAVGVLRMFVSEP